MASSCCLRACSIWAAACCRLASISARVNWVYCFFLWSSVVIVPVALSRMVPCSWSPKLALPPAK